MALYCISFEVLYRIWVCDCDQPRRGCWPAGSNRGWPAACAGVRGDEVVHTEIVAVGGGTAYEERRAGNGSASGGGPQRRAGRGGGAARHRLYRQHFATL